eukprot:m.65638 g.65638  ORF g.65638 m.65638 type:complete len:151 (+) comp12066_c0_seq2:86-538(+)
MLRLLATRSLLSAAPKYQPPLTTWSVEKLCEPDTDSVSSALHITDEAYEHLLRISGLLRSAKGNSTTGVTAPSRQDIDVDSMLTFVQHVQAVDVAEMEPLLSLTSSELMMRKDGESEANLAHEETVANTAEVLQGFIVVPKPKSHADTLN